MDQGLLNRDITDMRRRTGLVVVLSRYGAPESRRHHYQESIFLPLRGERRPITETLHAPVPRYLRGSCNGLLLYENGYYDYVLDPFRRRTFALPKLQEWKRRCEDQVGLAYDGFRTNYHFQLVCFFYNEADFREGWMNCKVFYSQTWEWREFRATIHNNVLGRDGKFDKEMCTGTSMYLDGRIYWIWSICMLQYDTGNEEFNLFALPQEYTNGNNYTPFAQLLYESDESIYFCFLRDDSLLIFALNFGDASDDDCEWVLKRSVSVQQCIHHPELELLSEVRPCAFNNDFQQIILFVPPRRIVSYSLVTCTFAEVWTCEEVEGYNTQVMEALMFKCP